jgi:hypothetical protein
MSGMLRLYIKGSASIGKADVFEVLNERDAWEFVSGGSCPYVIWSADETDIAEIGRALSKRLKCDVVCLGFQSVADSFLFQYWASGECRRDLAYGWYEEQGIWERASGESQGWESVAIFSKEESTYHRQSRWLALVNRSKRLLWPLYERLSWPPKGGSISQIQFQLF